MNNNLPINQFLPVIAEYLTAHNSLVLQAEPGAGKSTAVPLSLINAGFLKGKKIVLLEPRRLAAKSIAGYLAKLLGEPVGHRVGYQIRNERKISKDTIIEIVTEGVLTRRLQHDPELADVGLIIFDEFHERSIHADLALMLALEVQGAYREDLKILVMSATIDTEQISTYLNDSPIIKCPGRSYPVTLEYIGKPARFLDQQVIKAVQVALQQDSSGDILVFLPGQGDIKRCIQSVSEQLDQSIRYLPLYGSLPLAEQELVLTLHPDCNRRVIFTTNIAETSLTIPGITTVIDSGLEKTLKFDVKSGLSRLETTYISKASATQRAGRAGRLQSGNCIRLWREPEHAMLNDFQREEITTSNLDSLVLELSAWGINNYADANWLTPPPKFNFDVACQLNSSLGLMDDDHQITPLGTKSLTLGVEPRLASMLLSCKTVIEQKLSCILAALLAERDIVINASNSDIAERVMIFVDYVNNRKSFRSHHKVNRGALEQVVKLAKSFANNVRISAITDGIDLTVIQTYIGSLLVKAYPDRLAQIRNQNSHRYLLANGRGVSLRDSDSMQGEGWLVICDCDGQNKDGFVFLCASITTDVIQSALGSQFIEKTEYSLDPKKEKVQGRKQILYRSLVFNEESLSTIDQGKFEQCVVDIVRQEGLTFLNWTPHCVAWLARAKWLADVEDSFIQISEMYLLDNLDKWLLPYISKIKTIKQLRQFDLYNALITNLTWQESQFLDQHAPISYVAPSGKKIGIRYDEHQGPTVSVVLQEMFGELTSPRIANNKIALRFELLSPARRPIQTTSDLENFWKTSYFDVAKDMKGRYIKHRWPDKPLEELPGRSIKRK